MKLLDTKVVVNGKAVDISEGTVEVNTETKSIVFIVPYISDTFTQLSLLSKQPIETMTISGINTYNAVGIVFAHDLVQHYSHRLTCVKLNALQIS